MTGLLAILLFGGAFFVLCTGIAVRIVYGKSFRHSPPAQLIRGVPALEVLNERFARGDISREEYLERRAFLEG